MYLRYSLLFFILFFFINTIIVVASESDKFNETLNTGPMVCFNRTSTGVPRCRVVTSVLKDPSENELIYLASLSARRDVADDAIKNPNKYMPIYVLDGMEAIDSFNPVCREIFPNLNNNHICLKITNKLYEFLHPCLMIYYALDKTKRITVRVNCQIALKEITLLAKRRSSSFNSQRSSFFYF